MIRPASDPFFGEVIDVYSLEDAFADGVLVKVGEFSDKRIPLLFTSNLFEEVRSRFVEIIGKGLELLKQPDKEDSPYMKLRVIEPGRIWVVLNAEGCTFMKPEDY